MKVLFFFHVTLKIRFFLERLRAEQSESADYASETFDFFSETEVGLIGFFDLLQKLPISDTASVYCGNTCIFFINYNGGIFISWNIKFILIGQNHKSISIALLVLLTKVYM